MALVQPPAKATMGPQYAGAPSGLQGQLGQSFNPAPSSDVSQIFGGQLPAGIDPSVSGLWSGLNAYELQPAAANLGAQTDLLTQQSSLQQQQLSDAARQQQQQAGFSLGQLGIQGSNIGLQRGSLQAQLGPGGFAEQQRGLTAQEQAFQTAQQQRALRSSATAAGAVNTSGTKQSWADILTQAGFEKQQLALQGKEQAEQYKTSNAQLDNAAKSLGISTQQVKANLQNALDQLGLQGRLDVIGVMQAVQQLQSGFLSGPYAQVIQQILQAAGIPYQSLLGAQPSTGSGQFSTPTQGQPGFGTNPPIYSTGIQ